jgi:hypothetical protein
MMGNTNSLNAYKNVTLSNSEFEVSVMLPDENTGFYRSCRFDWSGMISIIQYKGNSFIDKPFLEHNPNETRCGIGTAEEFSACRPNISDALGYPESRIGEGFIKIGVGILEKHTDQPYQFDKNYKLLKVGGWDVTVSANMVRFKQLIVLNNKHGYEYTKEVIIDEIKPEFKIRHQLKNLGDEDIHINHYCHHFFLINGEFVSANYFASFPFDPLISRNSFSSPEFIELNGQFLYMKRSILDENQFVGGYILGHSNEVSDNQFNIVNTRKGVGIHVFGSEPAVGIFLAIGKRYFSIEPQIEINIKKNELF